MAHRSTITSIWTTVLAALVALLAALGLGGKAAQAATGATHSSPAAAAPVAAVSNRPALMARRTWKAMMRGGSLPPTIKQRIRAEAHGKTPSVRRSTTALAAGSGTDPESRVDDSVRNAAIAAAARVGAARREMALAA